MGFPQDPGLCARYTTALSGTLWRHTLRWMLARAESVDEVPL